MSFWSKVFSPDPFGLTNKAYHAATGTPTSKEKREQQRVMNEQIAAYKEQTELTKQELARKKDEEQVEKRRIEEKQIRALRRNRSSQGFLNSQKTDDTLGQSSQLGG